MADEITGRQHAHEAVERGRCGWVVRLVSSMHVEVLMRLLRLRSQLMRRLGLRENTLHLVVHSM